MSDNSFIDKMNSLKDKYYADHKKNIIFKNAQKLECAKAISSEIDIETILQKTVFIIPNTNKVYLDYTVFKLFANPSNYQVIVDHIFQCFEVAIRQYGDYEAHTNLKSFTVSSIKRYEEIFNLFYQKSYAAQISFSKIIAKLCLYNTPFVIEGTAGMLKSIIDADALSKTVIYKKDNSDQLLAELLAGH
jgi:hypothetical protein